MNIHRKTSWLLALPLLLLPAVVAGAETVSGKATVLYSQWLGGSDYDEAFAIAADERGWAYVTGRTYSFDDFPGICRIPDVPPEFPLKPYPNPDFEGDAFILQLDSAGQPVVVAFPGGPLIDTGRAIAVNASTVFLGREAIQPDGSSIFVDQIHRSLYALLLSTGVEGGHIATVGDITADAFGNAYITGQTGNRTYENGSNPYYEAAYVTKVGPDGAVLWVTELDGTGWDHGLGIALDEQGNVYVTGGTTSYDFPTVNPFQAELLGPLDAFVAKLDPSGRVLFASYLGGSGWDEGLKVAPTADGGVFVAGTTASPDFPVTADAWQPEMLGGGDPFLVRVDASGALVQATYLGGSGSEQVAAMVFDRAGDLYLAGWNYDPGSPLADPDRPGCPGFISRLRISSGAWTSICLPEAAPQGLAVDPAGDLYVTGGFGDVYVARLRFDLPPDCTAATAAPSTLWLPNGRMVPVSIRGVTDPDGDPVTLRVTAIHQDEPLSRKGQPDASGLGTSRPSVRADRAGHGDGRVYHITFEATDPAGAACTGTVTVCVPHDRGKGSCGDGGAVVDSTGAP
ncbi:MAG TPA: SBBP repeat-containing protein [Thermoanaerobaculia bacterium]|nr:SBBP repeat-containing protein [Thermoanaerobaculia bacterium]